MLIDYKYNTRNPNLVNCRETRVSIFLERRSLGS
jgi:hypothetical protein